MNRYLVLVLVAACKVADPEPPTNHACNLAYMMALPNPHCEPVGTGIGWLPDTCICQIAVMSPPDATGKMTRTPTEVLWFRVGPFGEVEAKPVYSIPPPAMPQPKQPQLRKE